MPSKVDRGAARAVPLLVLTAALFAARPARADNDEGFDKKGDDAIAADKAAKAEKSAKIPGEKDKVAPPDPDAAKFDPIEDPSKPYRFIGLRFRDAIVPKFMINIFANGGASVNVPMVGPEFTTRQNHRQFVFALQYADYSMNPVLFKGHSDGQESYEIVSSSLKMLLVTVDFLYEVPVIDQTGRFSFLVGGGAGIGGVFGELFRTQAYPKMGNNVDTSPDNVSDWNECTGVAATPVTKSGKPYCDKANVHFNTGGKSFSEPSWANGGSKPLIFPWLALPQVGFRYKPIKQLETRFDLGFSTSGFFLGLAAAYGL